MSGRVHGWHLVLGIATTVVLVAGLLEAGTPTAFASAASTPSAAVTDPASLVDPFVGTGSGGQVVGQVDTFPGADMPFGMI
ncbi:MAG: hypothetical protein J2P22_20090, partial [Nocardioides sp.]|nr:hypothetical protein [Nocardioides sp.]